MPSVVTQDMRYRNAVNFIESSKNIDMNQYYIFIGKSDAWPDEELPTTPVDCTLDRKQVYRDLIRMKKLQSTDMSLVIPRINWTQNVVYDQYDDRLDMIEGVDINTGSPFTFYVLVDDTYVYKCLSNNNRAPSVAKPTGTSINSFQTADGYIWKFMYDLNVSEYNKYATEDWIPIRIVETNDNSNQWFVQANAKNGSIETGRVNNPGTGYNAAVPPNVTIVDLDGNGSGATATAVVNAATGSIDRIIMTSIGEGYTNPAMSIDPPPGAGVQATASPILSPPGGHGLEAYKELGAKYVMIRAVLSGTENGNFPVDVEYRQTGIILNPRSNTLGIRCNVSAIFMDYNNPEVGLFLPGDVVEYHNGVSVVADGIVTRFSAKEGVCYINVTSGTFAPGNLVRKAGNNAVTFTIDSITNNVNQYIYQQYVDPSDILQESAEIVYINNRTRIERKDVQDESFALIIDY